jgi:hypothetical protein
VISIVVGGVWFGMRYFSWIVASILRDTADRNLDKHLNIIALSLVAAFVMTQWDLVMDVPESTIPEASIWQITI